jgi:predicted metalloprotease with PDZ domain
LTPFKVKGITHRFIGFKLGDFDRQQFILDLKKVVEAAVNIIGHIPYKSYTFIAMGPGQGGIEHLNNTTFGFNGTNLNKRENYIRTLHFLAHEYFHHFNVKRIRPIELGPFDYDKGSRTKMLWVSEGLSVYYEYLIVKRAGISTDAELFNAFRGNMIAFENKPGRLYQTLEQASYETWSDGPFGRIGDEINKTISWFAF